MEIVYTYAIHLTTHQSLKKIRISLEIDLKKKHTETFHFSSFAKRMIIYIYLYTIWWIRPPKKLKYQPKKKTNQRRIQTNLLTNVLTLWVKSSSCDINLRNDLSKREKNIFAFFSFFAEQIEAKYKPTIGCIAFRRECWIKNKTTNTNQKWNSTDFSWTHFHETKWSICELFSFHFFLLSSSFFNVWYTPLKTVGLYTATENYYANEKEAKTNRSNRRKSANVKFQFMLYSITINIIVGLLFVCFVAWYCLLVFNLYSSAQSRNGYHILSLFFLR